MRALEALLTALLFTLASCSRTGSETDRAADGGRAATTARIVTVGSAVTETVFALGAGEDVVGVDTSSLHPEAARKLAQVGYQRALSAEGILALRPTLVLASNDAGPPSVLEQLRSAGVRVVVVAVEPTVASARERIAEIGRVLERDPSGVLATFDGDLARADSVVVHARSRPRVVVVYARGGGALQVFGAHTAAETMVTLAGGASAVTEFEGAKPLTSEALVRAAPDVVVVPARGLESIGGEAALLRTPGMAETPAGKNKRIVPLDDLLLLGMGPRTGLAALVLAQAIHPEIAPFAAPATP